MFSVGLFVIICSAIRLPVLLNMRHTIDPSYDEAPVCLWSYLEQAISIVCGCLPAFRCLLNYLFPSLRKGAFGSSGPSTNPKSESQSSGSKGETSTSRSRPDNYPSYRTDDIELTKKGTSQEQIVYQGDRASDDDSDHFRMVPPHISGEKMSTAVEVRRGKISARSEVSTLRGDIYPPKKSMLGCPKKMVRVTSKGEGEIKVTQTEHAIERLPGRVY